MRKSLSALDGQALSHQEQAPQVGYLVTHGAFHLEGNEAVTQGRSQARHSHGSPTTQNPRQVILLRGTLIF